MLELGLELVRQLGLAHELVLALQVLHLDLVERVHELVELELILAEARLLFAQHLLAATRRRRRLVGVVLLLLLLLLVVAGEQCGGGELEVGVLFAQRLLGVLESNEHLAGLEGLDERVAAVHERVLHVLDEPSHVVLVHADHLLLFLAHLLATICCCFCLAVRLRGGGGVLLVEQEVVVVAVALFADLEQLALEVDLLLEYLRLELELEIVELLHVEAFGHVEEVGVLRIVLAAHVVEARLTIADHLGELQTIAFAVARCTTLLVVVVVC